MTVIPFPDRSPVSPHDRAVRAVKTITQWYAGGQLDEEFEHEPEWDSEDSSLYHARIEAGLEPEWPDD